MHAADAVWYADAAPAHQLVVDELQVGLGVSNKVLQDTTQTGRHCPPCSETSEDHSQSGRSS
jgi:hypothetical protein